MTAIAVIIAVIVAISCALVLIHHVKDNKTGALIGVGVAIVTIVFSMVLS